MKVMITGIQKNISQYDLSLTEMSVFAGEVYDVISFEFHKTQDGQLIELPVIKNNRGETLYLNYGEFEEVKL